MWWRVETSVTNTLLFSYNTTKHVSVCYIYGTRVGGPIKQFFLAHLAQPIENRRDSFNKLTHLDEQTVKNHLELSCNDLLVSISRFIVVPTNLQRTMQSSCSVKLFQVRMYILYIRNLLNKWMYWFAKRGSLDSNEDYALL